MTSLINTQTIVSVVLAILFIVAFFVFVIIPIIYGKDLIYIYDGILEEERAKAAEEMRAAEEARIRAEEEERRDTRCPLGHSLMDCQTRKVSPSTMIEVYARG